MIECDNRFVIIISSISSIYEIQIKENFIIYYSFEKKPITQKNREDVRVTHHYYLIVVLVFLIDILVEFVRNFDINFVQFRMQEMDLHCDELNEELILHPVLNNLERIYRIERQF